MASVTGTNGLRRCCVLVTSAPSGDRITIDNRIRKRLRTERDWRMSNLTNGWQRESTVWVPDTGTRHDDNVPGYGEVTRRGTACLLVVRWALGVVDILRWVRRDGILSTMKRLATISRATLLLSLLMAGAGSGEAQLRAVPYVSGLVAPVGFVQDPGNPATQYVVQQTGQVRVIDGGVLRATPILDVSGLVSFGGGRGLLGLAC